MPIVDLVVEKTALLRHGPMTPSILCMTEAAYLKALNAHDANAVLSAHALAQTEATVGEIQWVEDTRDSGSGDSRLLRGPKTLGSPVTSELSG